MQAGSELSGSLGGSLLIAEPGSKLGETNQNKDAWNYEKCVKSEPPIERHRFKIKTYTEQTSKPTECD